MGILLALFFNRHDIADLHLERRYIDLASIDENMSVIYKLAGLAARGRKTGTIDDIVEPLFKHEKQVFARNALLPKSFFEVIAELLFQNEIHPLDLLLLAKLLTVTGQHLTASRAMLPRRVSAA